MSKGKTIVRVKKTANFVIVSRFPLEDRRLTWEARGLYGFLLAKPDNWQISLAHLTKSSPAGYDKTKRILQELVSYKYIRKEERRNQHGQFSYPEYTIYELPYDGYFTAEEKPLAVKPVTVVAVSASPVPVDPRLTKKQVNKEIKETTTTTTNTLIWPTALNDRDRSSIAVLSQGLDPVVVQILLDELAGNLQSIKNPVGYFRSLLNAYKANEFIPAHANGISSKREAKERGERRYEQLLRDSETRANLRLQGEKES